MADEDVLALTAVGSLGGTEELYLVDANGNSRKISLSALKAYVNTNPSIVPSSNPYRGARVKLTADLSLPNNATTIIPWQAAARDTNTFWSAGAPTRLTVPTGVTKVRVSGSARFSGVGASTTVRQLSFEKNGAGFEGQGALTVAGSSPDLISISEVIDVVAGDYFEMTIYHTSGTTFSMSANTPIGRSWFALQVVEAQ